jgi:branched-chain amino acid transport system permease protein
MKTSTEINQKTTNPLNQRWLGYGFRLALALFGPYLLILIPGFGFNGYTFSLINFALIFSIVAIGLNLLTGYAGQISLGHSALLAIGAYTTGVMTSQLGLPFVLSLVVATVVTGFVGFLLALPCLRLSGPYLAVATVGFSIAIPQLIKFMDFRTEGIEGVKVDKFNLPGVPSETELGKTPDLAFLPDLTRYYLLLAIVAVVYFLVRNLTNSKLGRAFLAIRESEIAAQAMSIGLARYKVTAFTLSAALTGLAGALYIGQIGRVSSEEFNLLQSILFLVMITVGGLGTLGGAVAGAIFMTVLPELTNRLSDGLQKLLNDAGLKVTLKNPQYILYGLQIILFVLFLPDGLAGGWQKLKDRFWPGEKPKRPSSTAEAEEEAFTPAGVLSIDQ